ncbi:dTDP-4-dehydrorhamnose reductase [Altererythrobacter aerius]|uniref:dTDP-4-dehydrorhamnose reductase n=1 Tax=Tsuneonella aeria TaxID=1837929 RepID=A0A6I4TEV2_9SPHN|nr:dTDP-4-dehydrorhamnose reductase [Tsuneonella aeria]MXO75772.1 dTDP-4-dehydrorhamnose reductase [Tsuneonella aeria]
MKALITGAAGQLGRALMDAVPEGWEATGLTRAELDLSDPSVIAREVEAHRPDAILNAAAYTAVDRAESDESAAFAVNAAAVGAIAHAARATGARLVHVSTDFVFDGTSPRAYRPDDGRNPLSVYGRSKAAGEDAAGPAAAIVRTAWVYGAGGANFVNTMLRLMRTRDEVRVVADQIGAPTWAAGLADTVWALALGGHAGVFHHSDAGVASWYDFAVAVQEEALALGMLERAVPVLPIATADYPLPAHRPAFSLLDSAATRALLGQAPTHWRVNLRHMLAQQMAAERGDRS